MLNKTILTLFIVKIGYWIVNKLINDNKIPLISLFYKRLHQFNVIFQHVYL